MTHDPTKEPSACHCCGFHAVGIGLEPVRKGESPRWFCEQCLLLLERIKNVRRMDPYELRARVGGMNAAAPFVEEFGPDLSEWEEEQVLQFCGAVWKGCADEMRRLVEMGEAPF